MPSCFVVDGTKLCCRQFLAQLSLCLNRWKKHRRAVRQGSLVPPVDGRALRTTARTRVGQDSANRFLWWYYQHEAETLADLKDVHVEPASSDEDPNLPEHVYTPLDDKICAALGSEPFPLSDTQVILTDENVQQKHLEVRYVAANSCVGIYRQYCALAELLQLSTCSLTVFSKVFKEQWATCLKRRSVTQHGKCDECEAFKECIRQATTNAHTTTIVRQYTDHQREQFADRSVYYSCRAASESFCAWVLKQVSEVVHVDTVDSSKSSVCLIIDGMDQAKFRVPRPTPLFTFSGISNMPQTCHVTCACPHACMPCRHVLLLTCSCQGMCHWESNSLGYCARPYIARASCYTATRNFSFVPTRI